MVLISLSHTLLLFLKLYSSTALIDLGGYFAITIFSKVVVSHLQFTSLAAFPYGDNETFLNTSLLKICCRLLFIVATAIAH